MGYQVERKYEVNILHNMYKLGAFIIVRVVSVYKVLDHNLGLQNII